MSYTVVAQHEHGVPIRGTPWPAFLGLGQTPTGTPDIPQWRADVGLAQQAGIPVLALKAIRSNESRGRANVVRFEPRIFNMLTHDRYRAQFPSDTGSSGTGTALPAAFNQAYRLDPLNTVKATSWGAYQVLIRDAGPQIMEQAGGDPARFIEMFNANPQAVSEQILVSWFNNRAPAQQAAQAMNWWELAHRYNGCCAHGRTNTDGTPCTGCDHYAGGLQHSHDLWSQEWEQVRNLPEIAEAAAHAAATTVRRHPIPVALAGVTMLAGASAFAWWAWSKRRRKSVARNRRR